MKKEISNKKKTEEENGNEENENKEGKNKNEVIKEEKEKSNSEENIEFEGEETLNINERDFYNYKIEKKYVNISTEYFPIKELIDKFGQKKIVLDSEMQREFVWNLKQKSQLIESILLGIPLPVIYIARNRKGILEIVDGKQRIETILEFYNNKLQLQNLLILKELDNKVYKDLEKKYKSYFIHHKLYFHIIKPNNDEKIKFLIFERVNRGGTQLNKQEIRNALYNGKSTRLLKKLSMTKEFKDATGGKIKPTRMKDRYVILRMLAFYLSQKEEIPIKYKGDIDIFLNKVMESINEFSDEKIKFLEDIFILSMKNSIEILGKDDFKLKGKNKFNMALFESLSYLMAHNEIILKNKNKIKEEVNNLLQDKEFIDAVTRNVNNISQINFKFNKIEQIINKLI